MQEQELVGIQNTCTEAQDLCPESQSLGTPQQPRQLPSCAYVSTSGSTLYVYVNLHATYPFTRTDAGMEGLADPNIAPSLHCRKPSARSGLSKRVAARLQVSNFAADAIPPVGAPVFVSHWEPT
ncbi:MAG: hypothetical protein ACKPKO_16920, partial [Candidatus Fonsibacter sp.]